MEVAVLGSPSLIVRTVSVDTKQIEEEEEAVELCESGGGCPELPVPNKPDGFCGLNTQH